MPIAVITFIDMTKNPTNRANERTPSKNKTPFSQRIFINILIPENRTPASDRKWGKLNIPGSVNSIISNPPKESTMKIA